MDQPHSRGRAFSSGFPESPSMRSGAWKAAYRLLRKGARPLAVLAAVVLLGAFLYEHIGAWRDRHVLTQIGRSVDIGGRTLNIYCSGEGAPTVIFVSARTAPTISATRQGFSMTTSNPALRARTASCGSASAEIRMAQICG